MKLETANITYNITVEGKSKKGIFVDFDVKENILTFREGDKVLFKVTGCEAKGICDKLYAVVDVIKPLYLTATEIIHQRSMASQMAQGLLGSLGVQLAPIS